MSRLLGFSGIFHWLLSEREHCLCKRRGAPRPAEVACCSRHRGISPVAGASVRPLTWSATEKPTNSERFGAWSIHVCSTQEAATRLKLPKPTGSMSRIRLIKHSPDGILQPSTILDRGLSDNYLGKNVAARSRRTPQVSRFLASSVIKGIYVTM